MVAQGGGPGLFGFAEARRGALAAVGTLAVGMPFALIPMLAAPAYAAGPPCVQTGDRVICTFVYTGAAQRFTVPAGVTKLSFDVKGASGGAGGSGSDSSQGGGGGAGGAGAELVGTLTVTPRRVLQTVLAAPLPAVSAIPATEAAARLPIRAAPPRASATCGGGFDKEHQRYLGNIVVYAHLASVKR